MRCQECPQEHQHAKPFKGYQDRREVVVLSLAASTSTADVHRSDGCAGRDCSRCDMCHHDRSKHVPHSRSLQQRLKLGHLQGQERCGGHEHDAGSCAGQPQAAGLVGSHSALQGGVDQQGKAHQRRPRTGQGPRQLGGCQPETMLHKVGCQARAVEAAQEVRVEKASLSRPVFVARDKSQASCGAVSPRLEGLRVSG